MTKIAQNGYKEVVLTGIHVASYGYDINSSLLDIIKLIHPIEGIERIRLGSIEPMTLTEDFLATVATLEKVCHHFHISLQSGCDSTLKRMNRKYTTAQFREVVHNTRKIITDVTLTTDMMVGFPGETDEQFEQSYDFAKEIAFFQMHVFQYSPRKGTEAADFTDQIPKKVKEKRSKTMLALSKENENAFYQEHIGQTMEIILENIHEEKNLYEGHTGNYMKVFVEATREMVGKQLLVRLDRMGEGLAYGCIQK